MQLIDKTHQQAELKTANSSRTEPQGKLSAKWKVVEGKLVCSWRFRNLENPPVL